LKKKQNSKIKNDIREMSNKCILRISDVQCPPNGAFGYSSCIGTGRGPIDQFNAARRGEGVLRWKRYASRTE